MKIKFYLSFFIITLLCVQLKAGEKEAEITLIPKLNLKVTYSEMNFEGSNHVWDVDFTNHAGASYKLALLLESDKELNRVTRIILNSMLKDWLPR